MKELNYFDAQDDLKLGELILIGSDKFENDIYILGGGSVAKVIERALLDLTKLFKTEAQFLFVDLLE